MKSKSKHAEVNGSPRKSKHSARRNVTFGLPAIEYRALSDDAATRGLHSIHQRGREIVIDYLNHTTSEEVASQIASLEQEVLGLHAKVDHLCKLIRRVGYIVVAVSPEPLGTETETRRSQQANEWVKRNMPPFENG